MGSKNNDVVTNKVTPAQLAAARKRLDEKRLIWVPDVETDNELYGEFLRIEENIKTSVSDNSALIKVDVENVGITGVWYSTVLKNQFEEQGIKPGDIILIRFLGKKDSKNGKEYDDFDVTRII